MGETLHPLITAGFMAPTLVQQGFPPDANVADITRSVCKLPYETHMLLTVNV